MLTYISSQKYVSSELKMWCVMFMADICIVFLHCNFFQFDIYKTKNELGLFGFCLHFVKTNENLFSSTLIRY